MSYIHYPLGAVSPALSSVLFAKASAPVYAGKVATSASSPTSAPPSSGYIWVAPAGGKAGYWRRANAGEEAKASPAAGEIRRVDTRGQPPGVSKVTIWNGTEWVEVEPSKTFAREQCEAYVPPAFVDRCTEISGNGTMVRGQWTTCAGSGISPEHIPACFEAAAMGKSGGRDIAVAVLSEEQAAAAVARRRKLILYGVLGLAALGAVYYVRKSRSHT